MPSYSPISNFATKSQEEIDKMSATERQKYFLQKYQTEAYAKDSLAREMDFKHMRFTVATPFGIARPRFVRDKSRNRRAREKFEAQIKPLTKNYKAMLEYQRMMGVMPGVNQYNRGKSIFNANTTSSANQTLFTRR